MSILAIDPGNTESAYALIDQDCRPRYFEKMPNEDLLVALRGNALGLADHVTIEMVASYGMAVGVDVFQTCVWIGRFYETVTRRAGRYGPPPTLVDRRPIKLHHCLNATASDANIAQALKDRFAPGERNHGKGTKQQPGWFHGFHSDIWQAYALAVYTADQLKEASAA